MKFARYLPQFDWDVTVLTVKDILYYQRDESLLEECENAEIVRTGSLDPLRIGFLFSWKKAKKRSFTEMSRKQKIFRFLEGFIFIPDSKILWIPFAFFRTLFFMKRDNIQAIISTGPPFSVHLLGMLLAKSFRLPWIADFRDGWTNNNFINHHSKIHFSLHKLLEKITLKNADKVTCISNTLYSYQSILYSDMKEKLNLIYNGFDLSDFSVSVKDDNKFTVTFTGALTEWANPNVFISVILRLTELNPEIKDNLRIRIIGRVFEKQFIKELEKSFSGDCIELCGYLSHKLAIEKMLNSNLLLFPITKNDTPGIITSKLFEYLATGIPILAHIPSGEARSLLEEYASDVFFQTGDNIVETTEYIYRIFMHWSQEKHNTIKKSEYVQSKKLEQFNRQNQSEAMALILNDLQEVSHK